MKYQIGDIVVVLCWQRGRRIIRIYNEESNPVYRVQLTEGYGSTDVNRHEIEPAGFLIRDKIIKELEKC